jgi:hypothetical protein
MLKSVSPSWADQGNYPKDSQHGTFLRVTNILVNKQRKPVYREKKNTTRRETKEERKKQS